MVSRKSPRKNRPAETAADDFYVVQSLRRTTARLKAYSLGVGRGVLIRSAPQIIAVTLAARGGVRPAAETAAGLSGKMVSARVSDLKAASRHAVDYGRRWVDALQAHPADALADMAAMGADAWGSQKDRLSDFASRRLADGRAAADGLKSDLLRLAAMATSDSGGLEKAVAQQLTDTFRRLARLLDVPTRSDLLRLRRRVRTLERRIERLRLAAKGDGSGAGTKRRS